MELGLRIAFVSSGMPTRVNWTLIRCYRAYSASFRVVLGLTTHKLPHIRHVHGMRVAREFWTFDVEWSVLVSGLEGGA